MLSILARFGINILNPRDLVTLTIGMWISSGLRKYGPLLRLFLPRKELKMDFCVLYYGFRPFLSLVSRLLELLDEDILL